MKFSWLLAFVLCLLISCGRGVYQKNLQGDYWLTALDSIDELALMNNSSGYMINIVEPKIVGFHSGENCIAVRRKVGMAEEFEMYIVPLGSRRIHENEEKNLIGPVAEPGFPEKFSQICDEKISFRKV